MDLTYTYIHTYIQYICKHASCVYGMLLMCMDKTMDVWMENDGRMHVCTCFHAARNGCVFVSYSTGLFTCEVLAWA